MKKGNYELPELQLVLIEEDAVRTSGTGDQPAWTGSNDNIGWDWAE